MKNNEYTLGDALMEERSSQAKWVVRKKLTEVSILLNTRKYYDDEYMEKINNLLQEALNVVENEL